MTLSKSQSLVALTQFLNRPELSVEEIDRAFDIADKRDPAKGLARNLLQTRTEYGDFSDENSILATPYIGRKTLALMLEVAATGALGQPDSTSTDENLPPKEEEEFTMRELFTSEGWTTERLKRERNCTFVNLRNKKAGAQFELSLESGRDPAYKATANFSVWLTEEQVELMGPWIEQVQKAFKDSDLEVPKAVQAGDALTMTVDINSNPNNGSFSAIGNVSLGNMFSAQTEYAGLNGSVEINAITGNAPIFLTPNNGEGKRTKIDSLNLHRDPRDGSLEAIATGLTPEGQIISQGVTFNRTAPPCGGATIPLGFPGGTLTIPSDLDSLNKLTPMQEMILDLYESAILTGMGGVTLAAGGKHKCVRHILQLAGAHFLCILGILAAIESGPGVVLALVACMGSKGLVILDMILAHLGWE